MQWQTKVSDAEFVRRVERFHSRRRKFSISMIVFSSLFVGLGWYFLQLIESGPMPFMQYEWQTPFQLGVWIGFIFGQIFFMSMFSLCFGVGFLFADRKDRLLLDYHRRLVELGELDEPRLEIPDRQA